MEIFPPRLAIESFTQNSATLRHTALFGFRHILQQSPDLASWSVSANSTATDFWEEKILPTSTPAQKGFWRLQSFPP